MTKHGRKIAAGVGAAGVLAVSGAALASSQTTGTATPSPSASSNSSTQQGENKGEHGGPGMRGLHDKKVTGTAETAVKNAVKAKDSAITVKDVRQAEDGSYRVFGTKADKRVMVEVSKDLKTVTVRTGMGHGPGERGHHGPRGTEVTGTTLTNVKNAVKAKDSAVTVEKVFKESDGTYRALGTKSGARVMVEVSKDLKTVTVKAGMPGGHGGPGGHRGPGGPGGAPGQAPDGQASNGQAPSGQAPQQGASSTAGTAA